MEKLLAIIFDMLKAKSPLIATIVLAVLVTANAFFSSQEATVLLGELAAKIGYWVSLVWAALQGTRTTYLINKK